MNKLALTITRFSLPYDNKALKDYDPICIARIQKQISFYSGQEETNILSSSDCGDVEYELFKI